MRTGRSINRLEWILGILLIILLIVVVVLSLLFWFRPNDGGFTNGSAQNSATAIADRADDVGPTPVFEGQTAKLAFASARQVAQSWAEDAQLLNASATWSQGDSVENLLRGETTWGFTFYSPTNSTSATITVVDEAASLIGQGSMPVAYAPFDISDWKLDSNEAAQTLLAQGGQAFIQQEGITIMNLSLLTGEQTASQQIEWLASLISTQNGRSLDLRINATTGEVLEVSQAP